MKCKVEKNDVEHDSALEELDKSVTILFFSYLRMIAAQHHK